jgi:tRNA-specific 2-thiouridylase
MYVVDIDPQGDVIVGQKEDMKKTEVFALDTVWTNEAPKIGQKVMAKIRSRFEPAQAQVVELGSNHVRLEFKDLQESITPGQAAVLYCGEECLGGGWISKLK